MCISMCVVAIVRCRAGSRNSQVCEGVLDGANRLRTNRALLTSNPDTPYTRAPQVIGTMDGSCLLHEC